MEVCICNDILTFVKDGFLKVYKFLNVTCNPTYEYCIALTQYYYIWPKLLY
jgi:hypothetical protein